MSRATTFSCPCWRATARGVNPSCGTQDRALEVWQSRGGKTWEKGSLWQRNRMETKRVWFGGGGIQGFWQDLPLEASLSSSVPLLECSDWLHSPEETSQPLDGFLVQPCRVEWNPSVSERRAHAHKQTEQQESTQNHSDNDIRGQRSTHTDVQRKKNGQKYRNKDTLTDGIAIDTTMVYSAARSVSCNQHSERGVWLTWDWALTLAP